MKKSVITMVAVAVMLAIISLLIPAKDQTVIYHHPVFVMGLLYLVVQTAYSMPHVRRLHGVRAIGFFLCHGAVVLIAIGGLLSYMTSSSQSIIKPIEDGRELPRIYEEIAGNGRMISTESFTELAEMADYMYEDQLHLYADEASLHEGFWLHVTSFVTEKDKNGAVCGYHADLKLVRDGEARIMPVSVNHPVKYGEYLFYLSSYDSTENPSYVVLTMRRDIGRMPVRIGLWLLILGTFMLCFFREKREVISA